MWHAGPMVTSLSMWLICFLLPWKACLCSVVSESTFGFTSVPQLLLSHHHRLGTLLNAGVAGLKEEE